MMNKNLVLGFGSEILSDQSIIPDLIIDLKRYFPESVDFSIEMICSLDLISLFERYSNLLILDTVQLSTLEIGELRYYSLDHYEPSLHLENYHDSSILETIETANKLGIKMPEKIGIATINTKEIYTISTNYSQELKSRYPLLLKQLKILIDRFFKLYTIKDLVVE